MKVGIMQPYFFPYIGYFQLIHAVDLFVIYDNIEYTKKGWVNRNRLLRNGADFILTLPLSKQSDFVEIRDKNISEAFNRKKTLNQIKEAYRKAPNFENAFSIVSEIIATEEVNLFKFLYSSLKKVTGELGIQTNFLISSEIQIDHSLKGQDKVIALCKALEAKTYVNAIGGQGLYAKEDFEREGLELKFIRSHDISYPQFSNSFVPWLSIIDVMMFNSSEGIVKEFLPDFELI